MSIRNISVAVAANSQNWESETIRPCLYTIKGQFLGDKGN